MLSLHQSVGAKAPVAKPIPASVTVAVIVTVAVVPQLILSGETDETETTGV